MGTRCIPSTERIDAFHPPACASGHADAAAALDEPPSEDASSERVTESSEDVDESSNADVDESSEDVESSVDDDDSSDDDEESSDDDESSEADESSDDVESSEADESSDDDMSSHADESADVSLEADVVSGSSDEDESPCIAATPFAEDGPRSSLGSGMLLNEQSQRSIVLRAR
jgi:hypothetical protein